MRAYIFPVDPVDEAPGSDALRVWVEMLGSTACVELLGPLDEHTAAHLDHELALITRPTNDVVIDLRGVTTLASAGARVLSEHAQRHRESGRNLCLRGASPTVRVAVEICQLEHLLDEA